MSNDTPWKIEMEPQKKVGLVQMTFLFKHVHMIFFGVSLLQPKLMSHIFPIQRIRKINGFIYIYTYIYIYRSQVFIFVLYI